MAHSQSTEPNQQQSYIRVTKLTRSEVEQQDKLNKFIKSFKTRTDLMPEYVVCSPGRVNLIGDHIDYHGFAVLPMAIDSTLWLGCAIKRQEISSPTKGIEVLNQIEEKPPRGSIALINDADSEFKSWSGEHSFGYGALLGINHQWQHYVLCGYHGTLVQQLLSIEPAKVLKHATEELSSDSGLSELEKTNSLLDTLANLTIVIQSDIPPASGLSSSSALVCGSSVATELLLHEEKKATKAYSKCVEPFDSLQIDALKLAESCSKFEQLIGTQGGGMDQAVIMNAEEGYAKYIEFSPCLSCLNVRLPSDTVWLVSHSGIKCEKALTYGYNARVLETKIGAALIVKQISTKNLGISIDASITLRQVKDKLFEKKTTQEIVDYLKHEVFDEREEFSIDEICQRLELTRQELIKKFNTSDSFLTEQLHNKLKLRSRCEHVIEEAERVERFKSICDSNLDIVQLGQLMTQSHNSLRLKFECSHPALDRLVDIALDAGALGSRLTGAGWGGCTISLVEQSRADTVMERLKEASQFTLRTEPQSGLHVIQILSE